MHMVDNNTFIFIQGYSFIGFRYGFLTLLNLTATSKLSGKWIAQSSLNFVHLLLPSRLPDYISVLNINKDRILAKISKYHIF